MQPVLQEEPFMLKRIKDSIFDILRQADWLLLCLCCGAALFGLVMIASATNFLNSWKMVMRPPTNPRPE